MLEVHFHPEAQEEYQDALIWYALRSHQAAFRFEQEVERVQQLIRENPLQFALYDDIHRLALLRRYPYTLVYEVISEKIIIIAVAHTRRKPGYWWRRSGT